LKHGKRRVDAMAKKEANKIDVMVAGMGGQGLLTTGRLLAEAAMSQYKHVLYFPNYGPMMRGGESECTITLSDEEIGSPAIYNPSAAIVMGPEALTQLENRIKPGGFLFVDSSVIPTKVNRKDLKVFYVPATGLAMELGGKQVANLILLGAFIEETKALPLKLVEAAIEKRLKGSRGERLLQLNKKALQEGAKLVAAD
jgi:2-oxoglutarate ferredoxin oxidoreductase subunit gamma